MGAFTITEVNFLRLLKACETGLLKRDGGEDMPRETASRYKQYVRALGSYAEELQRSAGSEDGGRDSSGQRCTLSPDEMAQHQQKVALIEEALDRTLQGLERGGVAADASDVQARTDRSALTTVARKSVVRREAAVPSAGAKPEPMPEMPRGTATDVDAQDELQEQLAGDLLAMTRQFKQQQIQLQSHAKEDGQVLARTDELISSNAEKMGSRVSALGKLEGAVGGWETCKIIIGVVVCLGVFTFTFLFMRLVGKRG